MPPKSKIGSITHNSAEVNSKPKRGMLARFSSTKKLSADKNSSSNSGKTATGNSMSNITKSSRTLNTMPADIGRGNSSSKASVSSTSMAGARTLPNNSFIHHRNSDKVIIPEGIMEDKYELGDECTQVRLGEIPGQITALTDAASCLTDGFDESVVNPHRKVRVLEL